MTIHIDIRRVFDHSPSDIVESLMKMDDLPQEDGQAPDVASIAKSNGVESKAEHSTPSASTDATSHISPSMTGGPDATLPVVDQAPPAYQPVPTYSASIWPTLSQHPPPASVTTNDISPEDFLQAQLNSLLYGNIGADTFAGGPPVPDTSRDLAQPADDAVLAGLFDDNLWQTALNGFQYAHVPRLLTFQKLTVALQGDRLELVFGQHR